MGGAPGDWLDQTMDDRAAEAADAIARAGQRPDVDGRRIGLWGAGQAGWTLPEIAAKAPGGDDDHPTHHVPAPPAPPAPYGGVLPFRAP
ncbi:hypothetical protein [Streptomyces sp. BR123]|uniref:hypothetical protein n=1 Tax=Streptomyces sp. BR123 TaxID=2749828 RepID=UPI00211B0572|nr:hypothetical protein [Streptomyces sp. BR123]